MPADARLATPRAGHRLDLAQQSLGLRHRGLSDAGTAELLVGILTMIGVTMISRRPASQVIAALHALPPVRRRLRRSTSRPLVTRTIAGAFRVGVQLAAPFLVFGLLFNLALGVLSRLMPQMQVFFVGVPLSILIGFFVLFLVIGALMGGFLGYVEGVLRQLAPYS